MIDPMLVGAIGGIAIISAWLFETFEAVKRHKKIMDLKFSALSIIGVVLLVAYSWQIGNTVFFYLNAALFSIELFEIVYSIAVKKVHKKRKR
ncbi:MAG: hypothetical protein WA139_03640 [Candidatus Aenigmatarchaeota archaeon]